MICREHFNTGLRTIFVVHGYRGDVESSTWMTVMKDELLKRVSVHNSPATTQAANKSLQCALMYISGITNFTGCLHFKQTYSCKINI